MNTAGENARRGPSGSSSVGVHPRSSLAEEGSPGRARTAMDVAGVVALSLAVLAIGMTAPSTTHAYAQLQQIGAVVGTIESGDWLLPRDQMGGLARKPQLYVWLDAPVLMLTGIYNDLTFRLPTLAATIVSAVLVYFLGRRWYGRRVGLLGGALYATAFNMLDQGTIAVTDMLFTAWVIASISCADRLLFHRARPERRRLWAVGLWATILGGAMTKGWGVVNLALVGGTLALATGFGGSFRAMRAGADVGEKIGIFLRLIGRRWRRAIRATHFLLGIIVVAAALAPVWIGMLAHGGEEFRGIVRFEFVGRITGSGPVAPHANSMPAVANLMYYDLPVSVFLVGALLLAVGFRPIALPLCWLLAVLAPFSLAHGFRPDYLLPCFPATALLGAWAVDRIDRVGPGGSRTVRALRHVFATVGFVIGLSLLLGAAAYLLHSHMPSLVTKNLKMPEYVPPHVWWVLAALAPAGAALMVWSVRSSLQWKIRRVAAGVVVGMLGVMFLDANLVSRHARTRDGEKMIALAEEARRLIGDDPFAVRAMEKLGVELYLGRFGRQVDTADELNAGEEPWLLTCDRGLLTLGAYRTVREGGQEKEVPAPEQLGRVEAVSNPVVSQKWGRLYLIRLARPIRVTGEPKEWKHESGRQDEW